MDPTFLLPDVRQFDKSLEDLEIRHIADFSRASGLATAKPDLLKISIESSDKVLTVLLNKQEPFVLL